MSFQRGSVILVFFAALLLLCWGWLIARKSRANASNSWRLACMEVGGLASVVCAKTRQLALQAGINDAFQAGCRQDVENGRANPPHMVSTNALGLCGNFGRVAVAF